jgi:predicted DNA binding CopG/RHH family protein
MSKPLKPIPEFASEAEERAFWESPKNDSTEYVDWTKAKLVNFSKLRPSTETISLRMPEDVLNTIRNHARKLDVPYQSLIKLWVAEKAAELAQSSRTAQRGARESETSSEAEIHPRRSALQAVEEGPKVHCGL